MFRCNEVIKNKIEWFDPPHLQTHFAAYKSPVDGAEDYIRFVSKRKRYAKAWDAVLAGDPILYSKELSIAGYYTASVERYTAGVVSIFREFLRRKSELMSWKPEPEPEPAPTEPAPPPTEPAPPPEIPANPVPSIPIAPVPEIKNPPANKTSLYVVCAIIFGYIVFVLDKLF